MAFVILKRKPNSFREVALLGLTVSLQMRERVKLVVVVVGVGVVGVVRHVNERVRAAADAPGATAAGRLRLSTGATTRKFLRRSLTLTRTVKSNRRPRPPRFPHPLTTILEPCERQDARPLGISRAVSSAFCKNLSICTRLNRCGLTTRRRPGC